MIDTGEIRIRQSSDAASGACPHFTKQLFLLKNVLTGSLDGLLVKAKCRAPVERSRLLLITASLVLPPSLTAEIKTRLEVKNERFVNDKEFSWINRFKRGNMVPHLLYLQVESNMFLLELGGKEKTRLSNWLKTGKEPVQCKSEKRLLPITNKETQFGPRDAIPQRILRNSSPLADP